MQPGTGGQMAQTHPHADHRHPTRKEPYASSGRGLARRRVTAAVGSDAYTSPALVITSCCTFLGGMALTTIDSASNPLSFPIFIFAHCAWALAQSDRRECSERNGKKGRQLPPHFYPAECTGPAICISSPAPSFGCTFLGPSSPARGNLFKAGG